MKRTLILLLAVACLGLTASAKKPAASLNTQLSILLDALGHCKVPGAAGKTFVIAIVHDSHVSGETVEEIKSAFGKLKGKQIGGKTMSTVVIPFEGRGDLTKKLRLTQAGGVFITENNEKIVREVLAATRSLKIVSMSNVPDYVHWLGVTLGVEAEGHKPKVMVNLASCQQEKVSFDEEVLAHASVYF